MYLQEWVASKQLVSESDDIVAEELERKKWGEWAMHASEKERFERRTDCLLWRQFAIGRSSGYENKRNRTRNC